MEKSQLITAVAITQPFKKEVCFLVVVVVLVVVAKSDDEAAIEKLSRRKSKY